MEQPAVPIRINPSPVPTMWELSVDSTQKVVVLTAHTSAGICFYFMDGDGAEKFGEQLAAAGRQANSGLVVPSGLIL